MTRPATASQGFLRRRPVLVSILLLTLIAAVVGGVLAYDRRQFDAARAAVKDDRLPEARRLLAGRPGFWPGAAETHLLLARVERLDGDFAAAERELREAARLRGHATEADQTEWLMLRASWGELDEVAPGLWEAVVRGHPDSAAILEALARVYLKCLSYSEARLALVRWLRLEPNCVRARDWYGLSLDRLDDNEGAVEEYLRVLELDPDRHATRLRLAEFYLSQRRFTDALPHLEHLLALQKDRPEVLTGLARVRLGLGDPDAARGFLERATTAEPDYLPALTLRGRLELETGHPAAAVPWLRRALKADPSGVEANYALYQCLTLEHGAEAEAREQLTRYQRAKADNDRLGELLRSKLSAAPGNPDLPCEVGQILLRMGQPTQALYWLNRALKLDPNHAGAHATLASYFESVGDVQQAGKHRVSSATR